MTDRMTVAVLLLSLALFATGCGDGMGTTGGSGSALGDSSQVADGSTSSDQIGPPADDGGNASTPQENESEVELKTVDKAAFQEAIASHKGQVVLVDFWGSWCGECREGFPHTVELRRRYADRGLQVIAMAIEYDEESGPPLAVEYLQDQKAGGLETLMSSVFDFEQSFADFGVTGESLPEYHIYGRDGKLVKVFSSDLQDDPATAFSHKDIELVIKEELAKPATAVSGG